MAAMWSVIFYTVLAVAAFYFILLQPVLKQQKEQRKAVRELQIGDEVVTAGGLIAEVVDVVTPVDGPTEIILQLAPEIRVRATTSAVTKRLSTLVVEDDAEASPSKATTRDNPAEPGIS